MLTVAIVFPIYNGLSYTKNCLNSLYNLTNNIDKNETVFSVVIVDDSSIDGSYEWILKNYPDVYLLKGNGNLWWSGGINLAVKYAIEELNTDYILWWNNDIIPDKDYFKHLVKILEHNTPETIIGSKIYKAQNKEIIWSMGGVFDPLTGYKNMIGSEKPDNNQLQEIIECDWLTGMGTVTHVSVYQKVGMVDEKNFPQYHGDSDFTFRAKKRGYNLIVNPKLKIYNDTDNSGLIHNDNINNLFRSLFSIRSSYNIVKEYKFYRLHAKSFKAYFPFINKYFKYIGGFFKWKVFRLIGKERKSTH